MNIADASTKPRIGMVGYGQMGHEIERLAPAQGLTIGRTFDVGDVIDHAAAQQFDVAIEFTHPDAVLENIRTLVKLNRPIVVGTTGWLEQLAQVESIVAEGNGTVIYASNFSIGVNIFFALVREAGRLFNEQAQYDAAIHEVHHVRKADSPSGTALSAANILLNALDRKRTLLTDASHGIIPPGALHVSSQRLGSTVGAHTVTFDSDADTLELSHRAKNRSGFALGALMAAQWVCAQPPGLYRFEDLFG